jgi:hypothetical protein
MGETNNYYQELKKSQLEILKQMKLDVNLDKNLLALQQNFKLLCQLSSEPANNENFETAYKLFYRIFDAVPLMINYISDISIFRAQKNDPNELFNSQRRISYNKTNPGAITPGKFNAWYQPMFYGSMPYKPLQDKEYALPSMVAALETCKDLCDPNKTVRLQDFTVGRWIMNQTLEVINLCFDEIHLSCNTDLNEANKNHMKAMKATFSEAAFSFIKELLEYFSTLCRTGSNERSYYMLTALFEAIRVYYRTEKQQEICGIISPSAATEGRGLNIVIVPEAVDKYLILEAVTMDRYFLVMPEAKMYVNYRCSEIIENHQLIPDFNFTFNSYIAPAERFIQRIKSPRK